METALRVIHGDDLQQQGAKVQTLQNALRIRFPNGDIVALEGCNGSSIAEIRCRLGAVRGVPATQIQLVNGSTVLKDLSDLPDHDQEILAVVLADPVENQAKVVSWAPKASLQCSLSEVDFVKRLQPNPMNCMVFDNLLKVPAHARRTEWIVAQTVHIYQDIVQLVGVLEQFCSRQVCKCMCAQPNVRYAWTDEENPVPRQLPAPDYMGTLLTYAYIKFCDAARASEDGTPLPDKFVADMQVLLKRFFSVYAHAYRRHFAELNAHGYTDAMHSSLLLYVLFVRQHKLVDDARLAPLKGLIQRLTRGM